MVSDNNIKHNLDEIMSIAESLPIEEKAKLVQGLIGKQSGLSVVLDKNFLLSSVIMLINIMSRDELSEVLKAIANKLVCDMR